MSHRPDRAEIHRRALRAAAAVASFTAACGAADTTTAGTGADAAADLSDAAVATSDASADAGAQDSVTADTLGTDATVDIAVADQITAQDVVADAVGDAVAATDAVASGDAHGAKPDCTAVPNSDCCTALGVWCAAEFPTDTVAQNTCQFGPNFDSSTGCTPWGPPAPPAMVALA